MSPPFLPGSSLLRGFWNGCPTNQDRWDPDHGGSIFSPFVWVEKLEIKGPVTYYLGVS